MTVDINEEMNSDQYKNEESRLIDLTNSLMSCLLFTSMNCSRNAEMSGKHLFLFIIDDIFQSVVGIKMLVSEGIRNSVRRELRFLLEIRKSTLHKR